MINVKQIIKILLFYTYLLYDIIGSSFKILIYRIELNRPEI